MRQVFSSQRVETVEGVARLLREAGVDIYISNGRSYHSKRGSQFSYIRPAPEKQWPTLWVRHANDQPRAREILRAAGLLGSTRPDMPGATAYAPLPSDTPRRSPWVLRIRLVLLAAIAAAAVVIVLRRPPAPPAPAGNPAADAPRQAPPPEDETRVRITPVQDAPVQGR